MSLFLNLKEYMLKTQHPKYKELYKLVHVDSADNQTTLFIGSESDCEDYLDTEITDEQFNDTANNYYFIERKYD